MPVNSRYINTPFPTPPRGGFSKAMFSRTGRMERLSDASMETSRRIFSQTTFFGFVYLLFCREFRLEKPSRAYIPHILWYVICGVSYCILEVRRCSGAQEQQ